jgi:hypothetical protein
MPVQHPLFSINWHCLCSPAIKLCWQPHGISPSTTHQPLRPRTRLSLSLMTAPAGPGMLSQKQCRRLFRLFRDEIIAWLCCLRTSISREQPTSGFLNAVEPLPDHFPFSVDAIGGSPLRISADRTAGSISMWSWSLGCVLRRANRLIGCCE